MDTNTELLFEASNIRYAYPQGQTALDGVTLNIYRGKKIAILGANGCGKSSLLKMLDGLIFPQEGELRAFGEPLSEASLSDESTSLRFRRRVGYIFQNSDAQLFSPTARDEIAFGPLQMNLETSEVERRIDDVARLLEIQPLLDRAPFHLSGGEKKKVAIASSLVLNPDVLLLDEPTAALDPRSQIWLVMLLQKLHAAGKTLITATHDLSLVPKLADRVIVFGEDHKIAADGPTESILTDTDLLTRVNLIPPHWHGHHDFWHRHPRFHSHGE